MRFWGAPDTQGPPGPPGPPDLTSLKKAQNLADLTNVSTARTNLGVYSSTEVDTEIASTSALLLQKSQNLADVANAATARTNLDVPQTSTVLLKSGNLSGLANTATARSNLGVSATSETLLVSNNLSDLGSVPTALSNLGISPQYVYNILNYGGDASGATQNFHTAFAAVTAAAKAGGGKSSVVLIPKDASGNKHYKTSAGAIDVEQGLTYIVDPDVTIECTSGSNGLFYSKNKSISDTVFNEGIEWFGGTLKTTVGASLEFVQLKNCTFHNVKTQGSTGLYLSGVNRNVRLINCTFPQEGAGDAGSLVEGSTHPSYRIHFVNCKLSGVTPVVIDGSSGAIYDVLIDVAIEESTANAITMTSVDGAEISATIRNTGANIGSGVPFAIYGSCKSIRVTGRTSWTGLDSPDLASYVSCDKEFSIETEQTAMVSGDVSLVGWGASASVSVISATNRGGYVAVTASGAGITANPTIQLTYKDGGLWFQSIGNANYVSGGTTPHTVGVSAGAGSIIMKPAFTPSSGTTYGYYFKVNTRG